MSNVIDFSQYIKRTCVEPMSNPEIGDAIIQDFLEYILHSLSDTDIDIRAESFQRDLALAIKFLRVPIDRQLGNKNIFSDDFERLGKAINT